MDFIDKGELTSPWSTKLRQISEVQEFMSGKGPAIQFILKVVSSTCSLVHLFYYKQICVMFICFRPTKQESLIRNQRRMKRRLLKPLTKILDK